MKSTKRENKKTRERRVRITRLCYFSGRNLSIQFTLVFGIVVWVARALRNQLRFKSLTKLVPICTMTYQFYSLYVRILFQFCCCCCLCPHSDSFRFWFDRQKSSPVFFFIYLVEKFVFRSNKIEEFGLERKMIKIILTCTIKLKHTS